MKPPKVVEQEEIIENIDEMQEEEVELFSLSEMVPSNWCIEEDGEAFIFTNTNTRRVFEGTMEEFNELMRLSLKYN